MKPNGEVESTDEFDIKLIIKPTNSKSRGVTMLKLSKIKIIAKYLTGGITSVIEYLLDMFNELIEKLPKEEVAKYAQLAKDIANFVQNLANTLITNEAKKKAALLTAQAFGYLATALLDSKMTKEELEVVIEAVKAAVEAWKEAK